jgi:hypothetical protein
MIVKVPLNLTEHWSAIDDARQSFANDLRLRQLLWIRNLQHFICECQDGLSHFVRASAMKALGLRYLSAGSLVLARREFIGHRASAFGYRESARGENTIFGQNGQPSIPQVNETCISNALKL